MIDRIIEYSARNRFLVLLLVAGATAAGIWSLRASPLDAIPDLSDVQVIVFTDWPGRSPDIVEDQVTYPIITTMIAAPRVKYVRGESMFGYSFVNVVFEDGTDLYWARSRVLEYMQGISGRLPAGVSPRLGPDATGVGWVYEYALVDRSGTHTLADLRSFQDWYLRYWLESVHGVAEVASVGGFVKQYQVEINPTTLLAYHLPLRQVADAIRRSNNEVGGRLVEFNGTEYMVRGRGHVQSVDDIKKILSIPSAVGLSFIPMRAMGLTANIMSLGGIAVAIGAIVDAAIVVVEQTHKKLEQWQAEGRPGSFRDVVVTAVKQVGGPSFFSLLVIAVSFLPIFALEAQEGRLFRPLAFTKTFSMAIAAVLAVTLDPAVRLLFTRLDRFSFRPVWLRQVANAVLVGTIHSEETHPISRPLMRLYHPVVEFVLRFRWLTVALAIVVVLLTVPIYFRLGSEFMPPLNEGTILYMPTALPGMSITQARAAIETQDRMIKQFPEVEHVFGKAGRAETPTDPAPLSMFETVVSLKPEDQWRTGMTWDKLLDELDHKVRYPGMPNIWWMPIQTRTEMLAAGIRSVLGIKVFGPDLNEIGRIARDIEQTLATVPGTRSAFAERTTGGYYLNVTVNRDAVARYGMTVGDVQDIVESAIGGNSISQTVEGRERYTINIRYVRDARSDLESLKRVLVSTMDSGQIPLAQLADLTLSTAPPSIHDENGALAGFVFVDVAGRDIGSYVAEAKQTINDRVSLPPGYHLEWAGQFEYLQRAAPRLKLVVPSTLLIVFILLYLNTGSAVETMIILLAVPFSAVGAIWLFYLLGYNTSIAVWVRLIALLGVDAETGVFMLLYLNLAFDERRRRGQMRSRADLKGAIIQGAVQRLRPKVMTVGVMFMGLLPIMWSHGTGADVMKRIAAPMVGGIFTSFIMELLVYPAIYAIWRQRHLEPSPSTASPASV